MTTTDADDDRGTDLQTIDQLEPDQFQHWRDAARDRAADRDLETISQELLTLAENGETMTMYDAKILGYAIELHDRLSDDARSTTRAVGDRPAIHEIARIERLLRADERAHNVAVQVGENGARLTWDTWRHNEAARGSLLASVTNEIVATEAWGLSRIHDPHEKEDTVQSMLTAVRIEEADR